MDKEKEIKNNSNISLVYFLIIITFSWLNQISSFFAIDGLLTKLGLDEVFWNFYEVVYQYIFMCMLVLSVCNFLVGIILVITTITIIVKYINENKNQLHIKAYYPLVLFIIGIFITICAYIFIFNG